MLYAIDPVGRKIEPAPGAVGECSLCRLPLIPRCGRINIWHWSHRAGDCDTWSEGETDWHRSWKGRADPSWCEVVMPPHRADIRRPDGLVIELQYSSISGHDIQAREAFYGNMWWLFHHGRFGKRVRFLFRADRTVRLRWLGGRRVLSLVEKPIYCDLGGPVVEFTGRLDHLGGHGRLLSRSEFLTRVGLMDEATEPRSHSHYEIRWPKMTPDGILGTIIPTRDELSWWFQRFSSDREARQVFLDGSWRVVDPSHLHAT